jgi:uncharacterized metal-binding protein
MILACSGGSNVGQLSNQAAVELTKEGFGKIYCLAGVGGKLSGFVQSVKDTPNLVVIDGCPVGCAKAIFREAGLPLRNHIVVTELGIEKGGDLEPPQDEVDSVKNHIRRLFAGQPFQAAGKGGGCCCGSA